MGKFGKHVDKWKSIFLYVIEGRVMLECVMYGIEKLGKVWIERNWEKLFPTLMINSVKYKIKEVMGFLFNWMFIKFKCAS